MALALSWALGPLPSARADTPSSEGAADARRAEAKSHFEAGVQAFAERRYADAVQAFQRADAIEPSAPLSFNIARAYERLEDTSAALRWYRDYLRRTPNASNAAEVSARVAELANALAERQVQQVTVLSVPPGATVSVDHRVAGRTPLTLELPPGAHRVELRLRGHEDAQADFMLEPRIPQDVSLRLSPATTPSSSGPAPSAPARSPRRLAPQPAQRPYGVVPWVVTGAGAVSLLGALGFELARRSAESAAEDGSQLEYPEHYDSMQTRQTTARVLAGVGGALVIGGGVLFVLNRPRPTDPQVAVSCGYVSCGLDARGSF